VCRKPTTPRDLSDPGAEGENQVIGLMVAIPVLSVFIEITVKI